MKYLIDSDRTIGYLNGRDMERELLYALIPDGLSISAVTFAEVYEGVLFGRGRVEQEEEWAQFLRVVEVLDVDRFVASRFAAIRGELPQRGLLIPDNDLWIAATAIEYDLTLVTGNRRHFDRVPGLSIQE